MRELRDWMREKMRRRPRRGPNDSESTGKSGQELPVDQPAPLRPEYPAALPAHAPEPAAAPVVEAAAEPVSEPLTTAAHDLVSEAAGTEAAAAPERKIVVETQPENLATPPAEQTAAKSPKGYVVLAIGLPGSGKTTWYKRRGVTPLFQPVSACFGTSRQAQPRLITSICDMVHRRPSRVWHPAQVTGRVDLLCAIPRRAEPPDEGSDPWPLTVPPACRCDGPRPTA